MERRYRRGVLAGGLAILLTLAGCAKLLPVLFDGVDKTEPLPPTRRVRRDLLQEIEQLKRDLAAARRAEQAAREAATKREEPALPILRVSTWEDAVALLPRDASGQVNWVEALKQEVIAPSPGLGVRAREQAVLEFDVKLGRVRSKLFTVTYPHRPHTEWLACQNCHPGIFPLDDRDRRPVITMAEINAGRFCGACHGKVAFGPAGNCARCHAGIPAMASWRPPEGGRPIERAADWNDAQKLLPFTGGTPDWAKALASGTIAPRPSLDPAGVDQPVFPLDVTRQPPGNPTFRVVFPHAPHTAVLSCQTCHPAIFQMARGSTPITMAQIYAGQACGVCHGKVAFAVPTGCPRCHPALAAR